MPTISDFFRLSSLFSTTILKLNYFMLTVLLVHWLVGQQQRLKLEHTCQKTFHLRSSLEFQDFDERLLHISYRSAFIVLLTFMINNLEELSPCLSCFFCVEAAAEPSYAFPLYSSKKFEYLCKWNWGALASPLSWFPSYKLFPQAVLFPLWVPQFVSGKDSWLKLLLNKLELSGIKKRKVQVKSLRIGTSKLTK